MLLVPCLSKCVRVIPRDGEIFVYIFYTLFFLIEVLIKDFFERLVYSCIDKIMNDFMAIMSTLLMISLIVKNWQRQNRNFGDL